MPPRSVAILALAAALWPTAPSAAGKGIRFWNLTRTTVTQLSLAPAGTGRWGKNQCENDGDGEVDPRERLKITEVPPGRYDVRLADKGGRTCTVKDVEIKDGEVFALEEKYLTDCRR